MARGTWHVARGSYSYLSVIRFQLFIEFMFALGTSTSEHNWTKAMVKEREGGGETIRQF